MRSLGNIGNFFWKPFVVLRVAKRVLHKLGHKASLQLMQDTPDLTLKRCAISRKVVSSILDGDIGIFHWYNPSGCPTSLGLIQPLTEMSTRDISWGVKAVGESGWQPCHLLVPFVSNSWSLDLQEPGPVTGLYRDWFTFTGTDNS
jgi:hypothetical protein